MRALASVLKGGSARRDGWRIARVLGFLALVAAPFKTATAQVRISSTTNHIFNQDGPPLPSGTITVTDASTPVIKAATDLRIRIPAGFPMTWDTSDSLATIGGSAGPKVSNAVTYEDGGSTMVIPVTADFGPLDVLTIADLGFASFTTVAPADSLELVVAGAGGATAALDDKTISIVDPYGMSSAANQTFVVGDGATAAAVILVTDNAGAPTITAGKEIRLRIPTGFPMTWNTAITTVTLGGGAAAKVKTTLKGYEDAGKTAVVDVDVNFAAGDQVTISGLQFMNFTAAAAAAPLELDVNDDRVADALDDKTKAIGVPQFTSAANQNFTVGAAPQAISPITFTDYGVFGTVTAARDLRIRIPAGFPMTWLTSDLTATLGGSAAGKVSSTLSYEDAGRTLRLDVLTDFAPGDVLTIADLSYANFTASAALAQLELVVAGAGAGTAARDLRGISVGAPTLSSAASQTFVVGDAPTAAAVITVTDDPVAATITAGKEIRLRIPTGFPMTWNTAVTSVTLGGGAAAKVKTTLKAYEDAGKTAVVDVDVNFAVGDQVTISGLQFMNFTAAATAVQLGLDVTDDKVPDALDDKTKRIVTSSAVQMSSAANQKFNQNGAPLAVSQITVTEGLTPVIKAATDLRIRIPAGFPMTWLTSDLTATLGGSAAGKVSSAVSYEDGGRTLRLDVLTDFAVGDILTVAGLSYANFTAMAPAASLELVVAGAGGPTAVLDDKTILVMNPYGISSAANQTFVVGDGATAAAVITVTDNAGTPTITAGKEIRLRIPTGFPMTWNTAITSVTLGGGAAAKVKTTLRPYEDGGRTAVVDVNVNFAAGDQVAISGLQFMNFTATATAAPLELDVNNNHLADAVDDKTRAIGAPQFTSAANQNFVVGGAPRAISPITLTEYGAFGTVTAARDLRIRIPAGFPMLWLTSDVTATLGGSAAGKVSPTVSYEDAGRTLRLDVLTNFAPGDVLTIADLSFTSFTASAPLKQLELVLAGAGAATATRDLRFISVGAPTISSAANQTFVVGDAATAAGVITVTDDPVAATITAGKEIRLRIPTGFPMTWNTAITSVTLGGGAAAKVKTTLKAYEDAGKTAVVDVNVNFAAGDQVTISGLQFMNFTAAAAASLLGLDVTDDQVADAVDDKTRAIGAPQFTSAANQNFVVGGAPRAISPITLIDYGAFRTVTAAGDMRIRIPAGFPMLWLTSDVTATLGGSAAGKVSPTVSYEDAGRTLRLDVLTDFAAGDVLTIADLSFTSFTASAPLSQLELVVAGAGAGTAARDTRFISIGTPTISSAVNQSFVVGDTATAMILLTVTDDPLTPTITAGKEIRLRIPTGFPMTWNTAITTVTLGGGAAAKVKTTLKAYEDAGKTAVVDVNVNFVAGDQVTISGLQFMNFTAAAAGGRLELDVNDDRIADALDDKMKTILALGRTFGVSVTPDSTAVTLLPTNGPNGTTTFTVKNTGNGTDDFDLIAATAPGTAITVVSITGSGVTPGGTPGTAVRAALAPGDSVVVTVTFSVAAAGAGTVDRLVFTARSRGNPVAEDDGKLDVTVSSPQIAVSRAVTPGGTLLPGTELTYTITATNSGSANSLATTVVDAVAVQLQFKVGSVVSTLPPGITTAIQYSSDGGSVWTYTPVSLACAAPAGFDGCVTHIRWVLQNPLGSTAPNNAATFEYVARIK